MVLEGWKNKITRIQAKFEELTFQHVYREYNVEAHILFQASSRYDIRHFILR